MQKPVGPDTDADDRSCPGTEAHCSKLSLSQGPGLLKNYNLLYVAGSIHTSVLIKGGVLFQG